MAFKFNTERQPLRTGSLIVALCLVELGFYNNAAMYNVPYTLFLQGNTPMA